jgi:membrane protein YqaA with SNARE-associated domain
MFNSIIPASIILFFTKYGLLGLFINGMLSSIIPIPTELTVSALLVAKNSILNVFIVLTVGSIIGGFFAYYLGYTGSRLALNLRHKKNMTVNDNNNTERRPRFYSYKYYSIDEQRSHTLLAKYGWLILFLSPWIPIGGDLIPLVAGAKKYNINKFIFFMALGKTVKALAIVYFLALIFSSSVYH